MVMSLRLIKRSLLVLVILLVFYILYLAHSIWSYSHVNEAITADVAIVLGAGVWGDQPSPVFEERINHGIWLYKNDYVEKIILQVEGAKIANILNHLLLKSLQ